MKFQFDPLQRLVIVRAELLGPNGAAVLRVALDTGATSTLINAGILIALGYDPAAAVESVQITTGSGIEFAPRVTLEKMVTLGQEVVDFAVLSHTLPPSITVDGLLGLDFFRGRILTIDFRSGEITVA